MAPAANEPDMDVRALADEDLIPLMARGDARAFEAIYERHAGAAYSLAYRMVGARVMAEDVTQEAFLNLWRSGARYERARGSVRTWVLGIVHHRAIDALRRASVHQRRRSDDETAAERLEAPERVEEDVARADEAKIVRAAMDILPADQLKVIELAYFGGFIGGAETGSAETATESSSASAWHAGQLARCASKATFSSSGSAPRT